MSIRTKVTSGHLLPPSGGWVGISSPICLKTTVDTLSLSFPNDLSWKKQYD